MPFSSLIGDPVIVREHGIGNDCSPPILSRLTHEHLLGCCQCHCADRCGNRRVLANSLEYVGRTLRFREPKTEDAARFTLIQ
jgi:hypothetical protein